MQCNARLCSNTRKTRQLKSYADINHFSSPFSLLGYYVAMCIFDPSNGKIVPSSNLEKTLLLTTLWLVLMRQTLCTISLTLEIIKKTNPLAPTWSDLCWAPRSKLIWWVVYLPLWKIWVRQLGWWHSQYDGKNNPNVPNHQPDNICIYTLYNMVNHMVYLYHIHSYPIKSGYGWETNDTYNYRTSTICRSFPLVSSMDFHSYDTWKQGKIRQDQQIHSLSKQRQRACKSGRVKEGLRLHTARLCPNKWGFILHLEPMIAIDPQEMPNMFASIVRNHDLTSKNGCVETGSYPELQWIAAMNSHVQMYRNGKEHINHRNLGYRRSANPRGISVS